MRCANEILIEGECTLLFSLHIGFVLGGLLLCKGF